MFCLVDKDAVPDMMGQVAEMQKEFMEHLETTSGQDKTKPKKSSKAKKTAVVNSTRFVDWCFAFLQTKFGWKKKTFEVLSRIVAKLPKEAIQGLHRMSTGEWPRQDYENNDEDEKKDDDDKDDEEER
jgi:hypothetical protein